MTQVPIIQFTDVHFKYPGRLSPALDGANVRIPAGKKIAVVGPNGSGKTTLFLHCNGILKPENGTIAIENKSLRYDRASLMDLRSKVGIVFQNPDDQLFSASVYQDISFGPLNLGLEPKQAEAAVLAAADTCEIVELLDCPTHALSGGEKARVAIAGVLAMQPSILIADEPTASLDPWISRKVMAIFDKLVSGGKTVILATHNIDIARFWADYVIVMNQGRVLASDHPDVVFADHPLMKLTKLNEPLFE